MSPSTKKSHIEQSEELFDKYAEGRKAFASEKDRNSFSRHGLELGFDRVTQTPFLTNSEGQTLILNNEGKLELLLYCQDCGKEGLSSQVEFLDNNTCLQCGCDCDNITL